jgi:hypothetical protein
MPRKPLRNMAADRDPESTALPQPKSANIGWINTPKVKTVPYIAAVIINAMVTTI